MFPFDPYSCLGSGVGRMGVELHPPQCFGVNIADAVLVPVGVLTAGKEKRTGLKSPNNLDTKCFPT